MAPSWWRAWLLSLVTVAVLAVSFKPYSYFYFQRESSSLSHWSPTNCFIETSIDEISSPPNKSSSHTSPEGKYIMRPTSTHGQFLRECRTPHIFRTDDPPPFAFPASLFLYMFTGIVSLIMPFYNMFLRVAGHTWTAWQELRTASIIPTQRPMAAPPYRRKLKNAPTSVCSNKNKRKLLLSAFALLNQSLVHGQGLSLSSELKERDALRKHRD